MFGMDMRMGVHLSPLTDVETVPECYDPTHRPVYTEWLWVRESPTSSLYEGEYVYVREWDDIAELVEYAHGSLDGLLIKEDGHDVMEIW